MKVPFRLAVASGMPLDFEGVPEFISRMSPREREMLRGFLVLLEDVPCGDADKAALALASRLQNYMP